MCAVGHFLEEEGLATVSISLVRPHVEAIKPPRSLWVPFELGRPLGVPNDANFQQEVLLAALNLLTSEQGPVVLEDYPIDAPKVEIDMTGWACPISLKSPPVSTDSYEPALLDEIMSLQPWHDLARKTRSRTTFGVADAEIKLLGSFIVSMLTDNPQQSYRKDLGLGDSVKLACDDLKAFYFEAATAQPGPSSNAILEDWFWGETTAGKVLLELKAVCLDSEDPIMKALGNFTLVPRSQLNRLRENS